MLENSKNLIALSIGVLAGTALVLLVLAAVWMLWCLAVPAFWPGAPEWLASPGYWPFVGVWILGSWIGRAIFGRTSN